MDRKDLALRTLAIVKGYVGVSRASDRQQVTKFLNAFDLPFADEAGHPYPFCDAGFGYSTLKAYCDQNKIAYTAENAVEVFKSVLPAVRHDYLYLSASCEETRLDAVKRGIWLSVDDIDDNTDLLPGWAVLYNWQGGNVAHHIGCVSEDGNDTFTDIECNTSSGSQGDGGSVAVRTRSYNSVLGFIKTYC